MIFAKYARDEEDGDVYCIPSGEDLEAVIEEMAEDYNVDIKEIIEGSLYLQVENLSDIKPGVLGLTNRLSDIVEIDVKFIDPRPNIEDI